MEWLEQSTESRAVINMNTKHITVIFTVFILTVLCASAYTSVPTITDGIGFQYENITIGDNCVQIGDTNITNSATVVVAASNSPHKETADYRCTGVNDHITLNSAQRGMVTIDEIFVKSLDNPVMSGTGKYGGVWYYNNKYYYYGLGAPVVRYSSDDGVNWVSDGATNINAIVTRIWTEGATWYGLIRRNGAIYADTSSDGMTWSSMNSGNPVITREYDWETGSSLDPSGLIKVGTTYYLFYNTVSSSPRKIGYATSTDLVSWAKYDFNPVFDGNRFCADLFKHGSYYYLILSHFTAYHHAEGVNSAFEEFELYRCTNPTFLPGEREFLGVVMSLGGAADWDNYNIDTPTIACSNIEKTTFVNDRLELFYYANNKIGLAIASLDDLPTMSGFMGGNLVYMPGDYNTEENLYIRENVKLRGKGATIHFNGASTTEKAAIMPGDHSLIQGIKIIDESGISEIIGASGIYIRDSDHVVIEDVSVSDFAYNLRIGGSYNLIHHSMFSRSIPEGGVNEAVSINIDKVNNDRCRGNIIHDNTIETFDGCAAYIRGSGQQFVGNTISKGIPNVQYTAELYTDWCDSPIIERNVIINSTKPYGFKVRAVTTNAIIRDNWFDPGGVDAIMFYAADLCRLCSGNIGFITENSGTTTLVSGTTSIAVAHGLDVTPSAGDIMVTAMESLGSASYHYIGTYTPTTFNVTVNADPTQDVDFAWSAAVY